MFKGAGQHFLVDQRVLAGIVEFAELGPGDVVLEIGAGTGNLTRALSKHADKVIAIEKDLNLARQLNYTINADNVEIIHADALKIEFPPFNKVVSNLPYQISSPITFKLFKYKFDFAILMYQHEFAKRIVAKPGTKDYSRLTVTTQYFAQTKLLFKVPKGAFKPQPAVNSAIVKLQIKKPPRGATDEEFFSQIVKAAFSHRRKKLKNTLLANLPIERENIEKLSPRLSEMRAENLTLAEFIELANTLHTTQA